MADAPQEYTIFMLIEATPAWLALPPPERFGFVRTTVGPIMAAHPEVTLRYFDAEAYTARCSDVIMWQTRDLARYQSVIENLRETLFWNHYFIVREIIPTIEDGFANHYHENPLS